jgi:hypothetical protein
LEGFISNFKGVTSWKKSVNFDRKKNMKKNNEVDLKDVLIEYIWAYHILIALTNVIRMLFLK